MIPEEVAQIASILRDSFEWDESDSEGVFNYSVEIAWKIYNAMK